MPHSQPGFLWVRKCQILNTFFCKILDFVAFVKSKETYCWSIDNTDYHFYFRTVAEATAVPEAAVMKTLLVMTQNGMFTNSACLFDQTIQFKQHVDRKNDKQTPILLKR